VTAQLSPALHDAERESCEREFVFYRHPSADMLFAPAEVDAEVIPSAQVPHFGTISLISEPSRRATLHAIELARDAGYILSCDPNLRLALWPDRAAVREGLLKAIAQAQVVKLSDDELRFLTGSDDPAAARKQLWHDRLMLMVVTTVLPVASISPRTSRRWWSGFGWTRSTRPGGRRLRRRTSGPAHHPRERARLRIARGPDAAPARARLIDRNAAARGSPAITVPRGETA
jgi:hypothetical protein